MASLFKANGGATVAPSPSPPPSVIVVERGLGDANSTLAGKLRAREQGPDEGVRDWDRRMASEDAAARGDYDAEGRYRPFRPKRGD